MTNVTDIETAFDAAIDQVQRAAAGGLMTLQGGSARTQLQQLEFQLRTEQTGALARGSVDPDWVQKTIRWTVEWVPESDFTLIAALGRIARLAKAGLS